MYLRLGYTETTLLFCFWLQNVRNVHDNIIELNNTKKSMINWFYTTSGFYDKAINGDYFNFNTQVCLTSFTYNAYMEGLLNLIKDTHLILNFHKLSNLQHYKQEFEDYNKSITKSYSDCNIDRQFLFSLIAQSHTYTHTHHAIGLK